MTADTVPVHGLKGQGYVTYCGGHIRGQTKFHSLAGREKAIPQKADQNPSHQVGFVPSFMMKAKQPLVYITTAQSISVVVFRCLSLALLLLPSANGIYYLPQPDVSDGTILNYHSLLPEPTYGAPESMSKTHNVNLSQGCEW